MSENASLPRVTIVIPALNEGENLVDTVRFVLQNSQYEALEVVIVDDGSQDGSVDRALAVHGHSRVRAVAGEGLGVAHARNRGAAEAKGELLVFLDGHCYVPPGWLKPLVTALSLEEAGLAGPAFTNIRNPRMKACGVTWGDASLGNVWLPYGQEISLVPFHIGACQAVRAEIFHQVGGYDVGMIGWGSEDIELCLRLWLFGYRIYAQPASLVYHLFRTSRPYSVDTARILYNHLRLALLHLEVAPLLRVIQHMLAFQGIEWGLTQAFTDDTPLRRQEFLVRRKRDFNWFCHQFQMTI